MLLFLTKWVTAKQKGNRLLFQKTKKQPAPFLRNINYTFSSDLTTSFSHSDSRLLTADYSK